MRFEPGAQVFMASAGVGRIDQLAGRAPDGKPAPLQAGEAPSFYVVATERTVACVPIVHADQTLRPLVSRELAQQMLERLRGPAPAVEDATPLIERGKRVVHSGTPLEHATFLRELYALPAPLSDALIEGLRFLAALVLPEIAAVLELDGAALEAEMRQRYPAASSAFRFGLPVVS